MSELTRWVKPGRVGVVGRCGAWPSWCCKEA